MANIASQEKRNRQNKKRRSRNLQIKSAVRTSKKKVLNAFDVKENMSADQIRGLFLSYIKTVDSAAQKGILKMNTAARKKSRLAKKVNSLLKQAQG